MNSLEEREKEKKDIEDLTYKLIAHVMAIKGIEIPDLDNPRILQDIEKEINKIIKKATNK